MSDVKQFTLDAPASADLYVPLHQMPAFQGLASLLFGSAFERNPRDPLIYGAVALVLGSVAPLATYLPIRSAASANPVDTLQG